jgi:hypothetical protein
MRLRHALDLCTDTHSDDWVKMPSAQSGRPATAMLAGVFDPGAKEPDMRPLAGHSIAVYDPDARLSLVWPMPEAYDDERRRADGWKPEWAETDSYDWKHARDGWAVILLGGAPIWQERVWYLDWGSGIGGYVPDFEPVFAERDAGGPPELERWEVTQWAAALARLINSFSAPSDWPSFDPTTRVAPSPSPVHPVDAVRAGSA